MPQIGILFDVQKLGSGFYGYTAFRIFFAVLPPRELAACGLYHGEVGRGRNRSYCIAIECGNLSLLQRMRQAFAATHARGLLGPADRFLDEPALRDESLAPAARITPQGELTECRSRWVLEAWERAQGKARTDTAEKRVDVRFPEIVPAALRWSPLGTKAFAYLVAASIAGTVLPWAGWGIALCALVFFAGAVQGMAIRLRLGAEEDLCGEELLGEVRRFLNARPLGELAGKLEGAGALASPLLRRIHAMSRATDASSACLTGRQFDLADSAAFSADAREVRTHAWGLVAMAGCSLAAMAVFQGPQAAGMEAGRLALAGAGGCALLCWMAALLTIRRDRFESRLHLRIARQWLPLLAGSLPAPKTPLDSLEQAIERLATRLEAMHASLEQRRDTEFVETMAELRSSLNQLTPVLEGFREPFVLQAVPANGRAKAMAATA